MVKNMTEEMKAKFIQENAGLVPRNKTVKFHSLSTDGQVEMLENIIERKQWREEWEEKNRVPNRLIELFEKRHGTVEDAREFMKWLQDFIMNAKQREIEKIDEEIAKLQLMKKTLED